MQSTINDSLSGNNKMNLENMNLESKSSSYSTSYSSSYSYNTNTSTKSQTDSVISINTKIYLKKKNI